MIGCFGQFQGETVQTQSGFAGRVPEGDIRWVFHRGDALEMLHGVLPPQADRDSSLSNRK